MDTPTPAPTGFVKVNLAKEWCGHAFGDEVEVDPERAEWMRENGFVMEEEMVAGLIGQAVWPVEQAEEDAGKGLVYSHFTPNGYDPDEDSEPEYPDRIAGYEDDDPSPYDPDKEI